MSGVHVMRWEGWIELEICGLACISLIAGAIDYRVLSYTWPGWSGNL